MKKRLGTMFRELFGNRRNKTGNMFRDYAVALISVGVALSLAGPLRAADQTGDGRATRSVAYHNDKVPEGPWSIHTIKIDRHNPDYTLHSMLGNGVVTGMKTLSDQVNALSAELGRPIAAVNGDFYVSSPRAYSGDPQGIQILQGELLSAPTEHACFWTDALGKPHTDVVQSLFRITWPHGSTTPFGLNEERRGDTAVIYTPRMGASTGTKGDGRELILEVADKENWLPLRVGTKIEARIKEIREASNTPIKSGEIILSLGPQLLVDAPEVEPGDVIEISTATLPDLKGSQTAIGGGPRLLVDGKTVNGWKSAHQRHPRTALGWNDDFLFLFLVDGRQPGRSVGMGFQEMADYFLKLGCQHAMNLDGGGSASMWLLGHVISRPSEGQERPVANGLVLIKNQKEEAP